MISKLESKKALLWQQLEKKDYYETNEKRSSARSSKRDYWEVPITKKDRLQTNRKLAQLKYASSRSIINELWEIN